MRQRHARFGTLDLVQVGVFLSRLDVVESSIDTTLPVSKSTVFKQDLESIRLVPLDLAMLDGNSTGIVIRFYHFVGSGTVFVLRRLGSNPNVQVMVQLILAGVCPRVEDNIRVTRVKLSIVFFGPFDDLEFLNSPYFDAWGDSNRLPVVFSFGGGLFDFLVQVGADKSQVRLFPRNAFFWHDCLFVCLLKKCGGDDLATKMNQSRCYANSSFRIL